MVYFSLLFFVFIYFCEGVGCCCLPLKLAGCPEQQERIDYRFFEVENREGIFHYTYQVKPGVSDERVGMYILNQEKVEETIRKAEE